MNRLVLVVIYGNGEKWGLNGIRSSTVTIAPRQTDSGSNWFIGTADAIYQNLEFIGSYNPENVLILSGDHIYRMDYSKMLETHLENNADLTISVIEVTLEEAKRFGFLALMKTDGLLNLWKNHQNQNQH